MKHVEVDVYYLFLFCLFPCGACTGILLSRIKVGLKQLRVSIINLDEDTLSLDNSRSLLRLVPTPEEVELLTNYKGDVTKLGNAEQFFLEMMAIPRLVPRLEAFVFKREFSLKSQEVREDIRLVNQGISEVARSTKFKGILQLILAIGNSLNEGTFSGDAAGFKAEGILKLKDTRSSTGYYTLLHYLVNLIEEKRPELLKFADQLPHLKPGVKDRIGLITADVNLLKKSIANIESELKLAQADPTDIFSKKITLFYKDAKAESEKVELGVKEMQKGYDDLATYFGEEKADVVAIAYEFSRDFNTAVEDNLKARAVKERLAKKAKAATVMSKRKNLVQSAEVNVQQNAKFLIGANHVELRKRLQKTRQTYTNRNDRGDPSPDLNTLEQ